MSLPSVAATESPQSKRPEPRAVRLRRQAAQTGREPTARTSATAAQCAAGKRTNPGLEKVDTNFHPDKKKKKRPQTAVTSYKVPDPLETVREHASSHGTNKQTKGHAAALSLRRTRRRQCAGGAISSRGVAFFPSAPENARSEGAASSSSPSIVQTFKTNS